VDSAESFALAANRRTEVMAVLDRLPPRQREVLVLRYYLDLSESDIAETLSISRGAVKSHASRAMSTLRQHLATRTELEDQS
jgi:RNA polymerase sigma factor (sigma-70 family)